MEWFFFVEAQLRNLLQNNAQETMEWAVFVKALIWLHLQKHSFINDETDLFAKRYL